MPIIIKENSVVITIDDGNESVYGLAYTFGEYTNLSIQLLKDAGFTMAFTTNYGNAKVGQDKYLISRTYIYNEYGLEKFKRIVN